MTATSLNDNLQGWADITIKMWIRRISQLRIGETRALVNSFVSHVLMQSGGDVAKIEFAFKYYGKFVDMGVGRGVKINDVGIGTRRRAKTWLTPVFFREVAILRQKILTGHYGNKFKVTVIDNVDFSGTKNTATITT